MYDIMMVTELPRIKKEDYYDFDTIFYTFYIKAINPKTKEPVCIECSVEYNNPTKLALYGSCNTGDIILVKKEWNQIHNKHYIYIERNLSAEKRLAEFERNYSQLCKEYCK